jgi:hypothetical protein
MIGRFQVMATLQAARAYVLGYSLEEAKSFGLKLPKWKLIRKFPKEEIEKIEKNIFVERLGDEMAYCVKLGDRKYFLIGDDLQTPEDFKKQIEDRFKGKFEEAWKEAIEIVKSYDKGVLLSQRYFYEAVYKPRRDELAEKWSQLAKSP